MLLSLNVGEGVAAGVPVAVPVADPVGVPEGVWLLVALPLSEVEPVLEGEAPAVMEGVGEVLAAELPLTTHVRLEVG